MTEAEWLACENSAAMLSHLADAPRRRKFILFIYACCCRLLDLLPRKESRNVVEMLGLYADGSADDRDLRMAEVAMGRVHRRIKHRNKTYAARVIEEACEIPTYSGPKWQMAERVASGARNSRGCSLALESTVHCRMIRDIFDNPFRPTCINPICLAWNEYTIPKLAQTIYDDRAFARLPILADALEDAGCDDPDILAHCRSGGEHVRGCWVLDLLLGKS